MDELAKIRTRGLEPEQVTLTPDERLRLLKQFYGDGLSKGEIPPDAISKATGGNAEASARLLAELRSAGPEKGASMLMKKSTAGPVAAQPEARSPSAPEGGLAGTLMQILANSVTVTDSDFQALTSARAKSVREYLIQNGKVEPERLVLAETPAEGVKSQGSRAYLQFR